MNFLKKIILKSQNEPDLNTQVSLCVAEIKAKWIQYNQILKFKEDVRLSEIIESFTFPIREFINDNYPVFLSAPPAMFWMLIFTAVLESGTHPKDIVNEAVAELEQKFAR